MQPWNITRVTTLINMALHNARTYAHMHASTDARTHTHRHARTHTSSDYLKQIPSKKYGDSV